MAQPMIAAEPDARALPTQADAAIAAFSAELAGLDAAPPAAKPLPPSPAPQCSIDDPLAPLKAMSADELIALFS